MGISGTEGGNGTCRALLSQDTPMNTLTRDRNKDEQSAQGFPHGFVCFGILEICDSRRDSACA